MTQEELQHKLEELISGWENEVVEFKEANDNFSTSDIGKYFSALSNEANLKSRDTGWLVFGVRNRTRSVVGTKYREDKNGCAQSRSRSLMVRTPALLSGRCMS